jgi:PAS domain S-box-containing protein
MLRLQSRWTRYGLPIGATEIVCLLYFFVDDRYVDSDVRYFGFLLAVIVSALLGGMGPGLLATGLSGLGSAYLFLSPVFSVRVTSPDVIARLILFVGEGVLLSVVGDLVRDSKVADSEVSPARGYLTGLLFVCAATGLKLAAFAAVERELPFTFFYAAIVASTLAGGLGPGLAATILSSVAARYFFLEPRFSLSVLAAKDADRIALFVLEGIILAGISAKYPRARQTVRDALAQIRQHKRRMLKSVEDVRALRLISKDVIWELDLATNRMLLGTTQVERPETPAATLSFSSWLLQIHPQDRAAVKKSFNSALQNGSEEWQCEYRRWRSRGTYAPVSDHAYIVRDEVRNPVRVIGRTADLKTSSGKLSLRSERGHWPTFEQHALAILLTDNELRIVTANRAACEVLGYSLGELTRMKTERFFEPARRQPMVSMLMNLDLNTHPFVTIEEECIRADGKTFRGKIDAAVISALEGQSNGRVIMIEKLSQEK